MEKRKHRNLVEWTQCSPVHIVRKIKQIWWQRVETVQQDDGSGQDPWWHRLARRIAFQRCSFPKRQNRQLNCRWHPASKTPESFSMELKLRPNPSKRTISQYPSIFEKVTGSHIREATTTIHGSDGLSGPDATGTKRLSTFFKDA